MSPPQFYREQAVQQTLATQKANLENVHARCERAAQAWNVFAARIERADQTRAEAGTARLLDVSNENPDCGFSTTMINQGER